MLNNVFKRIIMKDRDLLDQAIHLTSRYFAIWDYTAKTVVLTGVHRGPHQAFYTGVKYLVLAQHPVVLF